MTQPRRLRAPLVHNGRVEHRRTDERKGVGQLRHHLLDNQVGTIQTRQQKTA
jgi:hypothetical protein